MAFPPRRLVFGLPIHCFQVTTRNPKSFFDARYSFFPYPTYSPVEYPLVLQPLTQLNSPYVSVLFLVVYGNGIKTECCCLDSTEMGNACKNHNGEKAGGEGVE